MIAGRVQGVFFRSSAKDKAAHLGVTGWITNRMDGRVETVLEGTKGAVEEMTAWCHAGPPSASVDHVDVSDEPYQGAFTGFQIK